MLSERLLYAAELRIRYLMRSILWSLLALLAAVAGLGFLGAALWLAIAGPLGPVGASLIVGAAFLAAAAFGSLMAWMNRTRLPPPRPAVGVDDLAQAFLAAVELGRSARKR